MTLEEIQQILGQVAQQQQTFQAQLDQQQSQQQQADQRLARIEQIVESNARAIAANSESIRELRVTTETNSNDIRQNE